MTRPKRRRSSPEASATQENNAEAPSEEAKWTAFRDEHVEFIEQLPLSLCRNYKLMEEIDASSEDLKLRLQHSVRSYMEKRTVQKASSPGSASNPPLEHHKVLSNVSQLSQEWLKACEEKVNLAQAAYDSVDRHVRLLDIAIKNSEEHLAKYKHPETDLDENYEHSGPTIRIPPNRSAASQKTISSFGLSERSRRLSARARKNDTALGGLTVVREDMRIDPNEPRYCFCNGVSWGEMIGCDSGRCELEWFHLKCVGLTAAPKNRKWYCKACKAKFL